METRRDTLDEQLLIRLCIIHHIEIPNLLWNKLKYSDDYIGKESEKIPIKKIKEELETWILMNL